MREPLDLRSHHWSTAAEGWFTRHCVIRVSVICRLAYRSGNRLHRLSFLNCARECRAFQRDETMASKQASRGRKQDRARVAGGQRHEVGYESKKSGMSRAAVK